MMSDTFHNQIIGTVRFSYPSADGFRQTDEDPAKRAAALYSSERLAQRLRLFERLTIPSLLAQTDPDFTLAVLIGDDMPDFARVRLEAALTPVANARVIALRPGLNQVEAVGRAQMTVVVNSTSHVTGFRLDDDDALDRNHIARLRARSEILSAMHGRDRPIVIGCNRGLVLTLSPDGNILTEVTEKLPIGIGLAMTAPKSFRAGIFRRNHRLVPQFFSTFTDAVVPAFIRTVHATNDSQPQSSGQVRLLDKSAAEPILAEHFSFDHAELMAL
jgi:hypothetical protein